jgi:hypothetical protein
VAEQAQDPRPRKPLEQLAPTAPERPISAWLIVPAALIAGVVLVAVLATQTNLVGADDREQELELAFERGVEAAVDVERPIDEGSVVEAEAAGYLRGIAEGTRIARQRAAAPSMIFPVDPLLVFGVPLANLDRAFLDTCPAEVSLWLLALHGVTHCGDASSP